MATHLLRDYLTQNLSTGNNTYIPAYLSAIFLRRVCRYTVVGNTSFNINTVGTYLIDTGDTTPSAAPTFAAGRKAGINIGTQKEFYVSIPVAVRTVSGNDIGRLLVLRSAANPRFNSGIFLIVGVEISSNSYVIDYRTLGDYPPVEATDSMEWYLYEKDINCPIPGTVNSKTVSEYRGDGNSTTPRIILQSPHAIGWQIRICVETNTDVSPFNNTAGAYNCPAVTFSPGLNGNSAGDFAAFGQHFHAPMWYNSSSGIYQGGAPGVGAGGTGIQYRITMVADDSGQGGVIYIRRPFNNTNPSSCIQVFGLPENEVAPLPVNNHARLFTIGSGLTTASGTNATNDGGLQYMLTGATGPSTNFGGAQGMSATPFGTPVPACAAMWAFIRTGGQGSGPQTDGFATDSVFTSSTELLPIDIMQGTLNSLISTSIPVYPFAPKIIGTIPHMRQGRSNFGDFSPTTDAGRAWQHLRRGLYIPWNGPNIIP